MSEQSETPMRVGWEGLDENPRQRAAEDLAASPRQPPTSFPSTGQTPSSTSPPQGEQMTPPRAAEYATSTQTGATEPLPNESLAGLIGEVVSILSLGADLAVARRMGRRGMASPLSLEMTDDESRAVAGRVARLIARRVEVKSDLADAADVTGVAVGIGRFLKRIIAERPAARVQLPQGPTAEEWARMQGRSAELGAQVPQQQWAPPPAPPQAPPSPPAADARYEPGSGPVRGALLGGW